MWKKSLTALPCKEVPDELSKLSNQVMLVQSHGSDGMDLQRSATNAGDSHCMILLEGHQAKTTEGLGDRVPPAELSNSKIRGIVLKA